MHGCEGCLSVWDCKAGCCAAHMASRGSGAVARGSAVVQTCKLVCVQGVVVGELHWGMECRVLPHTCLCVATGANDEPNEVVAWVLIKWDAELAGLLLWSEVRGGLVVGVLLDELCDDLLLVAAGSTCIQGSTLHRPTEGEQSRHAGGAGSTGVHMHALPCTPQSSHSAASSATP